MTETEKLLIQSILMIVMIPMIGVIGLFINGVFGFVLFKNMRAIAAAKKWASTMGTIVASDMQKINLGKGQHSNLPDIAYTYEVNGQPYKNNRLYAGTAVGGEKRHVMEKFLAQYPEGSQIEVFYDPQNPKDSTLHKTNPNVRDLFFGLIVGNIAMCAVIPFVWYLIEFAE